MKITKIFNDTQMQNDWEDWSHASLREASNGNIYVETIHMNGNEIIFEGVLNAQSGSEIL